KVITFFSLPFILTPRRLYYDLHSARIVQAADWEGASLRSTHATLLEGSYQRLWRTYFSSTNIRERRNMKLHLQNVPSRYWKYLSEKHPSA
ncbi:MAG TPA: DUF4130 domain-containing protein, partial [Saprospiraceae bacterium]|nr:DUF4130 domain-containing protein [Saprospiraceae bacterium]